MARGLSGRLPWGATLAVALCPASVLAQAAARLPERAVDLREPAPGGRVIAVAAGASLQRALDAALPGDTLALDPRGVFVGPFHLPGKGGHGWITIRSGGALPGPGTRIGPADAARMPKLVAGRAGAIVAAAGAHHYRLVGLEVRPPPGAFVDALVVLGGPAMPTAALPHHIVLSRCLLHGDPVVGGRRGIALNGGEAAVVDSHLSDFKERGADSQAIAGWAGPGPFLIANNYLEAAGENLLFGGADPPAPDRIPSDIEVRGNLFSRPLAWKTGSPGRPPAGWTIKNLLELKNARRVLIEGNVFERNWAQAQNGFAILFTVRNQDGTAPWSVVEDVTFRGNLLRDVDAAINVLGRDDSRGGASQQTRRITIRDNRFERVGGAWGGSGTLLQLLEGTADVVVEDNTALQGGSAVVAEGPPHTGFVFRRNIVMHNRYGIVGTGTGSGGPTLGAYFPGAAIEGNVFVGGDAGRYPRGNVFASSLDAVFSDPGRRQPRAGYRGAGARTVAGAEPP